MPTLGSTSIQKTTRGFALYVGFGEDSEHLNSDRAQHLIQQLLELVAEHDSNAETFTAIAAAPKELHRNNLDIVKQALSAAPASPERPQTKYGPTRKTGVTIDFSRKQIFIDGHDAGFSFREFEILKFLVLREGIAQSREAIESFLIESGYIKEELPSRALDVAIRRIRAKLQDYEKIIKTVRGAGYRFDRHADVYIVHSATPSPDRL